MPMLEYYTIDRTPQEVRNLWEWAKKECQGKVEHENLYAFGILAAMEYLMGESEALPQKYKGVFSLGNLLRQSKHPDEVGSVSDTRIDEPLNDNLHAFRPGNPKCVFYDTSLFGRDITGRKSGFDNAGKAFGSDTDNGSVEG